MDLTNQARWARLLWVELPPLGPAQRGALARAIEESIDAVLDRLGAAPPGFNASVNLDNALSDQLYRARLLEYRGLVLHLGSLEGICDLYGNLDVEDSAVVRWWIQATTQRPLLLYIDSVNESIGVFDVALPLSHFIEPHSIDPHSIKHDEIEHDEKLAGDLLSAAERAPVPHTEPAHAASSAAMQLSEAFADRPVGVAEEKVESAETADADLPGADEIDWSDEDLNTPLERLRVRTPEGGPNIEQNVYGGNLGDEIADDDIIDDDIIDDDAIDYDAGDHDIIECDVDDHDSGEADIAEGYPLAEDSHADAAAFADGDLSAEADLSAEDSHADAAAIAHGDLSAEADLSAEDSHADAAAIADGDLSAEDSHADAAAIAHGDLSAEDSHEAEPAGGDVAGNGIEHTLGGGVHGTERVSSDELSEKPDEAPGTTREMGQAEEGEGEGADAEESPEQAGQEHADPNQGFLHIARRRWQHWHDELNLASGPKPLAVVERMFTSAYVPLREAMLRGIAPDSVRATLERWSASFEKSYAEAFDALRVRGKRPTMVLDVPDLAHRIGRLHGARTVQLILVDSLRFDLGLRVHERLKRRVGSSAALTERLLLWAALPSTTAVQLELIGKGPTGLRDFSTDAEQKAVVGRGHAAATPRRIKAGHRDLLKLDLVEAHFGEPGAPLLDRLDTVAEQTAQALADHFATLPPRTLVMVFGDHGFLCEPLGSGTGASVQGGASPDEVFVPAFAWLTGRVH